MRKIFFISMVIGMSLVNAPAYCEDLPEPIKEMVLKDIGFYEPVTIRIHTDSALSGLCVMFRNWVKEGVPAETRWTLISDVDYAYAAYWEEFLVHTGYLRVVGERDNWSNREHFAGTDKLRLYGRNVGEDKAEITLAKRVLKSIDYTNRWKIQPDNLDAWSFAFTYFFEPNLPELDLVGTSWNFKGNGTATLNPATGQWETRFSIKPERGVVGFFTTQEQQKYGSSLGDCDGFAYSDFMKSLSLKRQSTPKPEFPPSAGVPSPQSSEATPQLPGQVPSETTEKITVDSLTKNLPYGNYNTGRFQAIEKTYNVTFDDAWAAANKVILGTEAITTSDRDKGILIGQGEGIGVRHWTAAIIEKITDYSVKITVKRVGYRVQGDQTVNLGPINFQIKTKTDTNRGVTVTSGSELFHKFLEKELKSKEKQPPYFVAVDGKQYKVSGEIFTGKKEGRVFKNEKGDMVRNLDLAKKIAEAAWVYENIVKVPGIPNSQRVSAILETCKDLRRYELAQDILARASVQILAATISGGATLTYTVPAGLTWRVVRDQFVNLKGLLSLTGRQGLEEALSKYQQMESLIAKLKPNSIDEATAVEIRRLYESAYGLDLPYSALLTSLMPKKGRKLVDKALKDIGDELIRTLPLSDAVISDAVLTNRELFDLQGKMDDALTANPALKEYYEKLNLAKRLKEANEQTITTWAEWAVLYKE